MWMQSPFHVHSENKGKKLRSFKISCLISGFQPILILPICSVSGLRGGTWRGRYVHLGFLCLATCHVICAWSLLSRIQISVIDKQSGLNSKHQISGVTQHKSKGLQHCNYSSAATSTEALVIKASGFSCS